MEEEKILYAIKCMYTFKLNLSQLEGNLFKPEGYINGYIWGRAFDNTLQSVKKRKEDKLEINRSRFHLKVQEEYNVILTYYFQEGKLMDEQADYVSKISNENRKQYIKCWLLLGLLSNTYEQDKDNTPVIRTFSSSQIIFGNFRLANVEISLENYLVSLGDVDVLFDKLNLGKIGVEKDNDYHSVIENIKNYNKNSILCAQKIASNIDLAMKLKAYCFKYNDYKEKKDQNSNRNKELVIVFLKNIAEYMEKYVGFKIGLDDLLYFKFDENDKVDICELYARLIELAVGKNEKHTPKFAGINEFKEKITTESSDYDIDKIYTVSSFLKIKSAKNVISNLDNLANNIQRYRSINKKVPENLKVEELCDYYTQVVQLYLRDENTVLSDEMYEKYKEIARINYEITK